MAYPTELKTAAKSLYRRGWKPPEISEELGVQKRVVYLWAANEDWDAAIIAEKPEDIMARRIAILTDKEKKTDADYNEIDRLATVLVRLRKIPDTRDGQPEPTSDNSEKPKRDRKDKKGKVKNDISQIDLNKFDEYAEKNFFLYQKRLRNVKGTAAGRIRNTLKTRQAGLTWYFAFEALEDACRTGDNQIFLSASRNQSEVFRGYIIAFMREIFDIDITGSPIVLSNGAELYFLSTNARTAQSYHGHVYVDEYFWIPGFENLNKLASAMATHKKWRKTYFSTPSTLSHQGYPFWSGAKFLSDEGNKKKNGNKKEWELNHKMLREGQLFNDGQFRTVITIEDAANDGCDLFDIEQLKIEYSSMEFANLFMCVFIDDANGVFRLSELEKCLCDAGNWKDFNKTAARPYGDNEVWIGYDPSRTRDDATMVVIAPPNDDYPYFRVLEKHKFKNMTFSYQAERIRDLTKRYRVTYIGIDATGIGYSVYDQVKEFFKRTRKIHYSVDSKAELVQKAIGVVSDGRLKFDAEYHDIAHAFLTIRQTVTQGGLITYVADRTDKTGHADAAFAVMHALINEPLSRSTRRARKSRMAIAA